MQIGRSWRGLQLARARSATISKVRALPNFIDFPHFFAIGDGFGSPHAGVWIISARAIGQKIQRQHSKLLRGARGQKQHRVVLRNISNFAKCIFALLQNFLEQFTAMGNFKNARASAAQIDQVGLQLLKHFKRHGGWTR